MVRTVERLAGLALVGRASVGPLTLSTPTLLESGEHGDGTEGLRLVSKPSPSGRRDLALKGSSDSFSLEIPVLTPEIAGEGPGIFPIGPRAVLVHAPFRDEAAQQARRVDPELLVLGNARTLWASGLPFVQALHDLRTSFGAEPLLWTPRVALPHRVPLLTYLGVDLVDTTEAELLSAAGTFLDPTLGPQSSPFEPLRRACRCLVCREDPASPLPAHARAVMRSAVQEAEAAARMGQLRELVEARLTAEPALAEMLRFADRDLRALLDERTPVVASMSRNYVVLESHRRPEMVRFRARLIERYRPPPSKTVLLLVPCSKTKPYRRSRTHRRFGGALEGLTRLERVHVVSVSSPIGLVPRELEDMPPARHYDIPVTGEWEESERDLVRAGLRHLRASGAYRSTVVHLDPREYSFLEGDLPASETVTWTLRDDRTTSAEALLALRTAVATALADTPPVSGGPLAVVREELEAIARVQFGTAAAPRLFAPPVRLHGRPWFQRVSDGTSDLATWREERGLFHLTVAGARRLLPDAPLAVEVEDDVPLEGDLFVPGVRHADEAIREGDSVVVLRQGRLAAVGEATLPGRLMNELARGCAVRVRHRAHGTTDSPKADERSPSDDGPVV